jgi:hypothetical protein
MCNPDIRLKHGLVADGDNMLSMLKPCIASLKVHGMLVENGAVPFFYRQLHRISSAAQPA